MRKLKYIVVGTGRSGTVYFARLLTSFGFPCGHESFFDYNDLKTALLRLEGVFPPTLSGCSQLQFDGKHLNPIEPYVSSLDSLVAESSYMAVPHLGHESLKDTQVIHVVRNPIKVVNSFVNYMRYFHSPSLCLPPNPFYEAFIYRHLPELAIYEAPYERAALYYVRWNEMIEAVATAGRFRVEEGPEPLQEFLGAKTGSLFDDRKVNTYEVPGERFDISMLPNGDVKDRFIEMGKRYGYRINSEYLLM